MAAAAGATEDLSRGGLEGLVVRRATPADAAGVARVLNEVIADGRFSLLDTPFSVDDEGAYIEGLPARGFIHVAELPGAGIIGFETLEPYASFATHELDHVATMGTWVDADHRRCGIGRRLWEVTARAGRTNGFEKIVTDVRADNIGSLAFHASLGFAVIGTARRQARVRRPDAASGGRPGASIGPRDYVDVVFIECFLDEEAGA